LNGTFREVEPRARSTREGDSTRERSGERFRGGVKGKRIASARTNKKDRRKEEHMGTRSNPLRKKKGKRKKKKNGRPYFKNQKGRRAKKKRKEEDIIGIQLSKRSGVYCGGGMVDDARVASY